VLDSTIGSNSVSGSGSSAGGAPATAVIVAIEGETGSAAFVTECTPTGSESGSSSWS